MGEQIQFRFGSSFLDDHAGQIIRDAKIAVAELVANAWDAGASSVTVTWPTTTQFVFSIQDDGHGMTPDEFQKRWCTLSYQRLDEQGPYATSPSGEMLTRRAFGKNGKGRHAAFCFGDEYIVHTWRDGLMTVSGVNRPVSSNSPFEVEMLRTELAEGHGTRIQVLESRPLVVSPDDVREVLGARFLVDPGFNISVNGVPVTFTDISGMLSTKTVSIEDLGSFRVHLLDARQGDRTMRHRGVAYWVNKRLVGAWSWETLSGEGRLLDGRTTEAKRYTFIVEADPLEPDVLPDWSGFRDSERARSAQAAIECHIQAELHGLLRESLQQRKHRILSNASPALSRVPAMSRQYVGALVGAMVDQCPTMREQDFSNMVEVAATLEKSRSGYLLIEQLAAIGPDDVDRLSEILTTWSIADAKLVLDQLHWRLDLILKMELLVNNPMADELHELQPLFQRGLWIFGPDFESIDFTSNKSITQIIRTFVDPKAPAQSSRRPDFVVLPDGSASIGVYGRPRYEDSVSEEVGPDRLVIVELKRGGIPVGEEQMNQARRYGRLLRQSGKLLKDTKIEAFVLGSTVDDFTDVLKDGDYTVIRPMAYDWVLSRAHSRTFRLLKEMESFVPEEPADVHLQLRLDGSGSAM